MKILNPKIKYLIFLVITICFAGLIYKIIGYEQINGNSFSLEKKPIVSVNYYINSEEAGEISKENEVIKNHSIELLSRFRSDISSAIILFNNNTYDTDDIEMIYSTTRKRILAAVDFSYDSLSKHPVISEMFNDEEINIFSQISPDKDYSLIIEAGNSNEDYIDLEINKEKYRAKKYYDNYYLIDTYSVSDISIVGFKFYTEEDNTRIVLVSHGNGSLFSSSRMVDEEQSDQILCINDQGDFDFEQEGNSYAIIKTGPAFTIKVTKTDNLTINNKQILGYDYLNQGGLISSDLNTIQKYYLIDRTGKYKIVRDFPIKRRIAVVVVSLGYIFMLFLVFQKRRVDKLLKRLIFWLEQKNKEVSRVVKDRIVEILFYFAVLILVSIASQSFAIGEMISSSLIANLAIFMFLMFFRFSFQSLIVVINFMFLILVIFTCLPAETFSEKVGCEIFALILVLITKIIIEHAQAKRK